MRLDEKIRKLRTDAGLSQQQLADALMVSRAAVAKWENDNGTPDVENLKALAAYFQCDLDRLLDDSIDLQQDDKSNSYCGKNCDACTHREQRNCPGCRMGASSVSSQGCAIGECCKRQYHNSCQSCSQKEKCTLLQTKKDMPVLLDQQIQEKKLKNEMLRRKKMFLGKWTWILFWLVVPLAIAGFLMSEQIAYIAPSLYLLGNILQICVGIAEGIILLHMSAHSKDFKIAGYCALILSAVRLWNFIMVGGIYESGADGIFSLPSTVLPIVYTYYFCRGFAGVLEDVDWELSEKWKNLRKALLIAFSSLIGSSMLGVMQIMPSLMLLLILVSVFAVFIIGVLRIVYMYKNAKAFCTVYF
jgi:DNA-binding XRE family transcriptional regulator